MDDKTNIHINVNHGNIKDPTHKFEIILLGDTAVGKTSYMKRLQSDTFDISNVEATIGVGLQVFNIVYNDYKIRIQIHDTCGQEKYRSLTTGYFKRANGAIIMFDLSNIKSWKSVEYWLNESKQRSDDNVKYIMVGNKKDIFDKNENHFKIMQNQLLPYVIDLCAKNNMPFYTISAKTGYDVNRSFCDLIKIMFDNMDEYSVPNNDKMIKNITKNDNNTIKLDEYNRNDDMFSTPKNGDCYTYTYGYYDTCLSG